MRKSENIGQKDFTSRTEDKIISLEAEITPQGIRTYNVSVRSQSTLNLNSLQQIRVKS